MQSVALRAALQEQLPILFAYIGWAKHYDGTEPIHGNFSWIKGNPTKNWEATAFLKKDDGFYYSGVGGGVIAGMTRLHVVFVSRDTVDHQLKVVGIYAAANVVPRNETWTQVRTKNAILLPPGKRALIPLWPGAQGVRRWAWRKGATGVEHPALRRFFIRLKGSIINRNKSHNSFNAGFTLDEELEGFEGEQRNRLVKHRRREARCRRAKIREALDLNGGRLICEVPKCKFDFMKRYGILGAGYAQVHHKKPLAAAPAKGQKVLLKDLAVVCANCHVMIHKDGKCRPLATLIP